MSTLAQGFLIEALRVEPPAGIVSGPGGREHLDPKVMDVLVHMAEHAGQVVLREELLARLWPHMVVTDDAITRCFYELRRCLHHVGGEERYRTLLETVPKRGYRLNARVMPIDPTPGAATPASRKRARLAALAVALGLAAIAAGFLLGRLPREARETAPVSATHSIAVLPFLDMSPGRDQGYFSDGVAEEILNRLSQSEALRVIARTSSFALRDGDLDVPQIAARLGVDYVLEGSVRRSGDRVRITAQLIDAATNSHLWSRSYDGEAAQVFAVQDEVARSVATALEVELRVEPAQARPPTRFEAYESYLQGRFHYVRRSPGDVERAIVSFEEAVAADPGYARAWAALAGAYALMAGNAGETHAEWRARQGAAASKAVELDPDLPVAQARLSQYYFQTGRPEPGEAHFQKALALNPNDMLVLGFGASRAVFRDDIDGAVDFWRRLVARDPLSPLNRNNYAHLLLRAGRLDEALAEFRKSLELNPAAGQETTARISNVLAIQGRYEEAASILAGLPEGPDRDYALVLLYRSPSHRAEAESALARLERAAGVSHKDVRLPEAYAFHGRIDDAFRVLEQNRAEFERELPERPHRFREFQEELRMSYLLMRLHADPRWQALTALRG